MKPSVFDTKIQNSDLASKIVVGLERISEAFKALAREHSKMEGLSPIQLQILIFLSFHEASLSHVSHLAKEFNITKPTISDAIRVLEAKSLIRKLPSAKDRRSYSIELTVDGEKVVQRTGNFVNPVLTAVKSIDSADQEQIFSSLTKLIYQLNRDGILTVQRTCFGCRFYEKKGTNHYCHFLESNLPDKELRLDCPEFEERS